VVREIDVRRLAAKLKAGEPVYLLDVREPWEHETASLPGDVLVPLDRLAARAADIRPPEGSALVVYCHHGVRSLMAARLLEQFGFRDVLSLAGGIDAWSLVVDPAMPRY